MAISTDAWQELGQSAKRVAALRERISQVQWFRHKKPSDVTLAALVQGVCQSAGVGTSVEIKHLSRESLVDFIRHYDISKNALWEILRRLPDEVRAALEQSNRLEWLEYAADTMPASVFHSAFDAAFEQYGALGQEVVLYAVSAAMWVAGAVVGIALVDDTATPQSSALALRLLELCEYGLLPLGPFDGVFYLA